jgi:hypothetical protein
VIAGIPVCAPGISSEDHDLGAGGVLPPVCNEAPRPSSAPLVRVPSLEIFLHLSSVIVDKIECVPSAVVVRARCSPAQAACPACGTWSSRVHSSYVWQVRDLPLGGRSVLIHLVMRRFLCM